MDISSLIKPLGIATYLIVAAALITGRFRAKLHLKLSHHRFLAYAAVTMATIHACLVLFLD